MTDDVTIANVALGGLLGSSRITALNDGSQNANAVAAVYAHVRDFVLRAHPWQFTKVLATLTVDGTAPDHEYDTRFAIPADSIRILDVDTEYPWTVANGYILANEADDLLVTYQKLETDEDVFDPLFVHCFALYLAYTVCEEVTQSSSKRKDMLDEFNRQLLVAKMVDAQESSPRLLKEDEWITVRY